MLVANTDGLGVYIRRTPNPNDKINVTKMESKMEVIGQAVESAGQSGTKFAPPTVLKGTFRHSSSLTLHKR